MNLILEIPASLEAVKVWELTRQIRQLTTIDSAVYVARSELQRCQWGEEIWIETQDGGDDGEKQQAAVLQQLSMLVRDWISQGAKFRLPGDIEIEI